MGYHRAGFDVVGVDVAPQPRYPFEFIQADALAYVVEHWREFEAIHASPPCQQFTAYRRRGAGVGDSYLNLIPQARAALRATGLPYVIENIPRSPLIDPILLCGSSFGLDVRRHRLFESNVPLESLACDHGWQTPRFPPATNRANLRSTVEVGVWRIPLDVQRRAMGIDWMELRELSEAIPPAYTEFLGGQLIAHLDERSRRMTPTSGQMPPPDKFLGVPTLPLFDLEDIAAIAEHADETTNKRATPPPAARGDCPRCRNVSVGLDADAGHYRWRVHSTYRARGRGVPCSTSGQLVHDLPPRDGHLVVAKPRDGKPNRRPAACGCEKAA